MTTNQSRFNVELHVKELNEKFKQLINSNFPLNNKKGSHRYEYEVSFAYALNEIKHSPEYVKGKIFEKATGIVNRLKSSQNKQENI